MNSLFKFELESCFLACYAPCHVFSVLNKPLHSYAYSFFIYNLLTISLFNSIYCFKNIKAPYNVFLYLSITSYIILSFAHYNIRRYMLEYENKYVSYCISFFLPTCSFSQLYREKDTELIFV
jgi:hypothetical protein